MRCPMHRILLDTSVYGKLATEKDILDKIRQQRELHKFVIYGSSLIRNELRATPKTKVQGARKLRILLLEIYDTFITKQNHILAFNKLIETLSEDYFKEYRKHKGHLSQDALRNDFIIIATATIYHLDIVVSDDENTMLSEVAVKSFRAVNKRYGLPDPLFRSYTQFKTELMRMQ